MPDKEENSSEKRLFPEWVEREIEKEMIRKPLFMHTSQPATNTVNNTFTTNSASGSYTWSNPAANGRFMGQPIPPSWRYDPPRRSFEHRSGIFVTEDEIVQRGRFPSEAEMYKMERRLRRDRAGRRRAGVTTRGKLTLEITEDTDMLRDLMEDLADLADQDGNVTLTIQGYGIDVRVLGSEFKEDTRERTAE